MRQLAAIGVLALLAAPAAADEREPVHLRVGTLAIDGSRYMKDMVALGADVERRTQGAVVIDWVSGGQLGEEAAMADLVLTHKLDGGAFSSTGLVALVPEIDAFARPGLFNNTDEVDRATAAVGPAVRELFAARTLTFAMWADLGFAHVFAAQPIAKLADALDAAAPQLARPLDGKLTEEITSGRARAWAVPPLYMLAMANAKARSMSNLRHHYVVGGLVFSDRAWARIDAADQAKVRAAFSEWEPKLRASWRKESDRGLLALVKSGVKMTAATVDEARAFVADAATRRATEQSKLAKAIAAAIAR
ncbi:MAG: TRAP transporter substrate-binding protein DctP [Polyangiales bacterium]